MAAKKRINFEGVQEKQKWPVASLLNSVTDAQVKKKKIQVSMIRHLRIIILQAVRAVAFSDSGKLIAVGANSGILRLFNTASLGMGKDVG